MEEIDFSDGVRGPVRKRCKVCKELIPRARIEAIPNVKTCVKHSDEKVKDHQPGVVDSLGLHEKYFPEGR